MTVNLSKTDLINLVRGTEPRYALFNNPIIKNCGTYYASYDRWAWNSNLSELSESQLWNLYKLLIK